MIPSGRMSYFQFRTRERGAVLLLVLGAVAILTILAVELAHRANLDVQRSERTIRDAAFRRTFTSGIELARGLLLEGRKTDGVDFLGDPWSKPVKVELTERARVAIQISDESGKLNLLKTLEPSSTGTTARKSLARLLAYLKKSDSGHEPQWQKIDAALRKRLGIDENTSAQPLVTLDGLREESNIAAANVFGSADFEMTDDHSRLCDFVTLYGDGRVNLNTAPAAVLYSLDEEYSDELVGQIEAWRGNGEDASSSKPFKTAKELETVPGVVEQTQIDGQTQVTKNLYTKIQDRLSVQSRTFSARIVAEVDGRQRLALAYFEVAGAGSASLPKLIAYEEVEP